MEVVLRKNLEETFEREECRRASSEQARWRDVGSLCTLFGGLLYWLLDWLLIWLLDLLALGLVLFSPADNCPLLLFVVVWEARVESTTYWVRNPPALFTTAAVIRPPSYTQLLICIPAIQLCLAIQLSILFVLERLNTITIRVKVPFSFWYRWDWGLYIIFGPKIVSKVELSSIFQLSWNECYSLLFPKNRYNHHWWKKKFTLGYKLYYKFEVLVQ